MHHYEELSRMYQLGEGLPKSPSGFGVASHFAHCAEVVGYTPNPMTERFFYRPILNAPNEHPSRRWEIGVSAQPSGRILDRCRGVPFFTPILMLNQCNWLDLDVATSALEQKAQ